jgi:hypothetical protein
MKGTFLAKLAGKMQALIDIETGCLGSLDLIILLSLQYLLMEILLLVSDRIMSVSSSSCYIVQSEVRFLQSIPGLFF